MELCQYPCTGKTRYYEIEAIKIPIVYNKYGDYDPNGLLYVLKKDADRVRECAKRCFTQEIPQPCEEVKPLVIRACKRRGHPCGNIFSFPESLPLYPCTGPCL